MTAIDSTVYTVAPTGDIVVPFEERLTGIRSGIMATLDADTVVCLVVLVDTADEAVEAMFLTQQVAEAYFNHSATGWVKRLGGQLAIYFEFTPGRREVSK